MHADVALSWLGLVVDVPPPFMYDYSIHMLSIYIHTYDW